MRWGRDRGGRSRGRWPNGVNANVFPGLVPWQTKPRPSHLNLGQRVWQSTSPAQHPAAVGMYTAVFLHLTLHHCGRLNRCCQGHSVFGSCQLSIIISVAYPFLFSHPSLPLPPHPLPSTSLKVPGTIWAFAKGRVRPRCWLRWMVNWRETSAEL